MTADPYAVTTPLWLCPRCGVSNACFREVCWRCKLDRMEGEGRELWIQQQEARSRAEQGAA